MATVSIRAGDTEPLIIDLDPDSDADFTDLDEVTTAVLYARKSGEIENHVTAGECTVSDSEAKLLAFDPVGQGPSDANAFDTGDEGTYDCYVLVTWSDDDTTRHPPEDDGTLRLEVTENFE